MIPDRIHIFLLPQSLGFDRLPAHSMADTVAVYLQQDIPAALLLYLQRIVHILFLEDIASLRQGKKLLHDMRSPSLPLPVLR